MLNLPVIHGFFPVIYLVKIETLGANEDQSGEIEFEFQDDSDDDDEEGDDVRFFFIYLALYSFIPVYFL